MKKIKKIHISKKYVGLIVFFTIIFVAVYVFLCYYSNELSVEVMMQQKNQLDFSLQNKIKWIATIKDILLIIISLIVSGLLSSFLEIKNKNSYTTDLIANDVLASTELLDMMTEENKKNILQNVECSSYFNGNIVLGEMYTSVKDTLLKKSDKQKIFLDNCEVDIRCRVKDNYIEKHVVKIVYLKSYDKKYDLKKYMLVGCSACDTQGYDPLEIKSVYIDGMDYSKKYSKKNLCKEDCSEVLDKKSGYNNRLNYIFDDVIKLTNTKSKIIKVEYVTRVPLNDIMYTFRVAYPCKSFRFTFNLENPSGYELKTSAFGFADDANNRDAGFLNDKKNVKISFDNWMFPLDGVAVVLAEEK